MKNIPAGLAMIGLTITIGMTQAAPVIAQGYTPPAPDEYPITIATNGSTIEYACIETGMHPGQGLPPGVTWNPPSPYTDAGIITSGAPGDDSTANERGFSCRVLNVYEN
jgi:hypothetical protein